MATVTSERISLDMQASHLCVTSLCLDTNPVMGAVLYGGPLLLFEEPLCRSCLAELYISACRDKGSFLGKREEGRLRDGRRETG